MEPQYLLDSVDQIPNISVISQIEVLRFNDTPENEAILNDFINKSVIHPLSSIVNGSKFTTPQKRGIFTLFGQDSLRQELTWTLFAGVCR
jgi:hypothetical protein